LSKIGLLSDSHGRAQTTRRGVEILQTHGAQVLLHMGDVGTAEVIDALLVEGVESRLVFGNCDLDRADLSRYATGLGVRVDDPVGQLNIGERKLVFMHGHQPRAMSEALEQRVAYLCHGHTHEAADQMHGATRVVNPGALYRAVKLTVALLDTDSGELTFYSIDKNG